MIPMDRAKSVLDVHGCHGAVRPNARRCAYLGDFVGGTIVSAGAKLKFADAFSDLRRAPPDNNAHREFEKGFGTKDGTHGFL
jgi:hypothetical protein